MSLVFPIRRGRILLGRKLARIGQGFFTGFGGRLEANETITQCAIRELKEETSGIVALEEDLSYHGVMWIRNPVYFETLGTLAVHVYTLRNWRGRFKKTDEMQPRYFPLDNIPYKTGMRESEQYWLPAVLNGNQIDVRIKYDEQEKIEFIVTSFHPPRP